MCNRYGYKNPLATLQREFSEPGHIGWDRLEPNAPLDQIRLTDRAPIIRRAGDGELEISMMRWGLVSSAWRGTLKDWMARHPVR